MTLPKIPPQKHGFSIPGTPTRAALSGQAESPLASRVGHQFSDPGLLLLAMTHRSYANEHPDEGAAHNERLEFLGDAVLDLVVSDLLYARYPELAEGELSKLRAGLVSEASLADLARELDLGSALRIGRGEASSGGRTKASLLSDALEAVIAAIYLDSGPGQGIDAVRNLVARWIGQRIEHALDAAVLDFKTELQEWAQKRYKESVHYRIVAEGGPDHEKTFESAVFLHERELARGQGKSKKQAEQAAARAALAAIQVTDPHTSREAAHE